MKTLNNIIKEFNDFADSHIQIKRFEHKNYSELTTDKVAVYPIMNVELGETIADEYTLDCDFSIMFGDQESHNKSNRLEIQSDMASLCNDLYSHFLTLDDYTIKDVKWNPFSLKLNNQISGQLMKLSLGINRDSCDIPIDLRINVQEEEVPVPLLGYYNATFTYYDDASLASYQYDISGFTLDGVYYSLSSSTFDATIHSEFNSKLNSAGIYNNLINMVPFTGEFSAQIPIDDLHLFILGAMPTGKTIELHLIQNDVVNFTSTTIDVSMTEYSTLNCYDFYIPTTTNFQMVCAELYGNAYSLVQSLEYVTASTLWNTLFTNLCDSGYTISITTTGTSMNAHITNSHVPSLDRVYLYSGSPIYTKINSTSC